VVTTAASGGGGWLRVRLAPELWLFVTPARRRPEFTVRYDGTASLGHVIRAFGVPPTEVGELRRDGEPAEPGDRPPYEAVLELGPVSRPQSLPEDGAGFLLDVHLGTLARRLRLIGVDAAYRNDAGDDELVAECARERRVLLTQDRGLLMRRALWAGAFVRGARPGEQLADVLDRFDPPLAPWTRCPRCNGLLAEVGKDEVADQLAPGTRRAYHRFTRCRRCGQVYWRGAHGHRLDRIVAGAMHARRAD
jgi:uncharacterized protein with PIN domain